MRRPEVILISDFDILTTTRAWVASPWDYNSCIGLRFRADGSGDMVFDRLQILRAKINFSFTLQAPNELILTYQASPIDSIANSFASNQRFKSKSKSILYSLTESETAGTIANRGPFTFYWVLTLDKSPFPDEVELGVNQPPPQFYGHNANEAIRVAETTD